MHNYTTWVQEVDPKRLESNLSDLLKRSGFDVLQFIEYHFTPHGYTALWLLGESHLAVHTFYEDNEAYIELSSCVKAPFDAFVQRVGAIDWGDV